MSSGGAPVKLASHDLQLATLISMGFEAGAAEQALERNDWKVSESIDYLLAAGIGMNDNNPAPPVMHDEEDDEKSVERQRLDIAASTMVPTVAPNSRRQTLPTLVEDRSRGHGVQDQVEDDWIDEPAPNTPAAPTRGRTMNTRRGDGSVGSADLTPPRRPGTRQERGRASNTRRAHFADDPLEQPRHSRNNQQSNQSRQTPAQDTNEHHEPPRYVIPPEPRHIPITYNERDYKPLDAPLDDPLGGGGVPTMASDGRNRQKRRNQRGSDNVDHGVHLATIQESFPGRDGIGGSRRQVGEDDISTMAITGGSRKQSAVSSLTAMPSVQEVHYEDAPASRKEIRRLYMLVFAAIVLVVIGIVVAVSLVLTIGRSPAVDNSSNASNSSSVMPTVAVTPAPSPVDGSKPSVPGKPMFDFGDIPNIPTASPVEGSIAQPTVTDGTPPPSAPYGGQLLDSPPQSLPPIKEDPAPSPAPSGENRRAEQQRREEKSQHYLRSRGGQ